MTEFGLYFEPMTGTHLSHAARALRDSGSTDTLSELEPHGVDQRQLDGV